MHLSTKKACTFLMSLAQASAVKGDWNGEYTVVMLVVPYWCDGAAEECEQVPAGASRPPVTSCHPPTRHFGWSLVCPLQSAQYPLQDNTLETRER